MRAIGIDYVSLTLTLPRPQGELEQVLLALTLQSKNLSNTCLFLVRNVFAAYDYDKENQVNKLKETLHPQQALIIAHYNTHIALINGKREQKHPASVEKAIKAGKAEKDWPVLKLIPLLLPVMDNLAATILDTTVLDNATRHWEDHKGNTVYKRLPGVMAQQVTNAVKNAFSSFFNATKVFNTNPVGMTGKPEMPHYRNKNDRAVIEIPLVQVHQFLPSLKGKVVYEDYLETLVLPPEILAAFSRLAIDELIDKACKKRGWTEYNPQHLRIVPLKKGVKMEVVVRVKNAYPANSFLDLLTRKHGTTLKDLKKPKQRNAWLAQYLEQLPMAALPSICGLDLGVTNLAAAAFSTGHKAEVHTGGRFHVVVGDFNDQIDAFVAANSTARAKELQGKKNTLKLTKERLSLEEHRELNGLLGVVYAHPKYLKLITDRKNWLQSFLHTLSHGIVMSCVAKKIDVLVIGKNIGWKQEMDMGNKNNRRFGQIAHATLINLITYKAELQGIAVVTTEESYTSKTSFVNGDELEVYDEIRKTTTPSDAKRPAKSGKRSDADRNRFVHKNRNDRWKIVHADVNGAFNIIRKVFKGFHYHTNLTLKFTLFRVSSRLGITPVVLL